MPQSTSGPAPFIQPHYDDVPLSCGGTVALLRPAAAKGARGMRQARAETNAFIRTIPAMARRKDPAQGGAKRGPCCLSLVHYAASPCPSKRAQSIRKGPVVTRSHSLFALIR